MSGTTPGAETPELSVVVPSYQSARWLPSTLAALAGAVEYAGAHVEVVVVDDGSTDDTREVVAAAAATFPGALHLIHQDNRGRFLARWAGLTAARSELVLLLDSRVLVDPQSIAYVLAGASESGAPAAWNAHVRTDAGAPLVGLFWEVPTHVFWGGYLRAPRPFDLTAETFDRAPKGTGMFLARRELLQAAFRQAWPEGDARLVSDDTKVLRWIAASTGIRLDPAFSGVYRPRTTVAGFLRHSLDRGTLFVDSYAGTGLLRSAVLIALAAAPIVVLAALVALLGVGAWALAVAVVVLGFAAMAVPLVVAAVNRCPGRSLLAYAACLPLFVIPFWLGLVRGVFVHRGAFRGGAATADALARESR